MINTDAFRLPESISADVSVCNGLWAREKKKSKMEEEEEEENGKDRMSSNKEMPTAEDIVVECVYRSRLVVDDDITRNREYIHTHTRRTMRND